MDLQLPESHSEVFVLTLTRSEKETLARIAQKYNSSMRTILRALIHQAGETEEKKFTTEEADSLTRGRYDTNDA